MVFGNVLVWLVLVCGFCLDLSSASGFCSSAVPESHGQHHHCDHGHDHRHHHKHHAHEYHQHHHHKESLVESKLKLPEELAEEEDMRLYGFGFQHDLDHDHDHEHLGVSELSGVGNFIRSFWTCFVLLLNSSWFFLGLIFCLYFALYYTVWCLKKKKKAWKANNLKFWFWVLTFGNQGNYDLYCCSEYCEAWVFHTYGVYWFLFMLIKSSRYMGWSL